MIADQETNVLYLSPFLEKEKPGFYEVFLDILTKAGIQTKFLPETKDYWAVDYMPIQLGKDEFVRFRYDPCYLRFKKYENKKTDGALVAEKLVKKVATTDIILDGGNVVKLKDKVIMTTRIFSENSSYSFDELVGEIKSLLKIDQLILVPEEPHDYTGHCDGMVRFIDGDTVLINDPTKATDHVFLKCFLSCLQNAGLKTKILLTYISDTAKYSDATGDYMNFLQMSGVIFIPAFGLEMDKEAEEVLQTCFPYSKVIPVPSNDLAKEGGILNCVSWNVME